MIDGTISNPALRLGRRTFLTGVAATGLLTLPACSSLGGFGLTEAVRRLLTLASQNAFATLVASGGFWDNSLARVDLPSAFGRSGNLIQNVLTSTLFRSTLQRELNHVAEAGAERAAPFVAETIRNISIADALALVRGDPTAASSFLRSGMNGSLVDIMIPALGDGMRLSQEPLVSRAIAALSGVDVAGVARSLSTDVDNAIWGQIGREEAAIRADPGKTNDPVLMGVFGTL